MGILEDIKENHGIDGAEYNVDPKLHAHEGFAIGDHVEALDDVEDEGIYAGDGGEVVAITVTAPGLFNPAERIELLVIREGMSPMTLDPDNARALA